MLEVLGLTIYDDFAFIYASGDYPQFSQEMANLLSSYLDTLDFRPKTLLDVACGEGTFAIAMAKKKHDVTGIDQSKTMLRIAREKAKHANVKVDFHEMDMRQLKLSKSFDIVTCWFDSLNYLLTMDDLFSTFNGIQQHLNTGGFFIFDLNTIHWLTTLAQRYAATIERETNEIFQVHRHTYDSETKIATFHLIAFLKENECWVRRVDEIHYERGYTLNEIRTSLQNTGLTEIASWGDFGQRLPVTADSKRVWFITKKE